MGLPRLVGYTQTYTHPRSLDLAKKRIVRPGKWQVRGPLLVCTWARWGSWCVVHSVLRPLVVVWPSPVQLRMIMKALSIVHEMVMDLLLVLGQQ